jgi:hypothetical protein
LPPSATPSGGSERDNASQTHQEGRRAGLLPSILAEPVKKFGEVAVGGKSYGSHCHHARHDDYSERQCVLGESLSRLSPNSGQQE